MFRKSKLMSIAIFIVLVFCLTTVTLAAENNIEDMNFKGADIRDVLRAIAEVADINLVTDGSVKGNITIHLRSITFEKALDLITSSHGLSYHWDGNTVVVATPERIEQIYSERDIRIIELQNYDPVRIRSIVTSIYPELNIQLNPEYKQLILVGESGVIEKALNLIEEITPRPEQQPETAKETGEREEKEKTEKTGNEKIEDSAVVDKDAEDSGAGDKITEKPETAGATEEAESRKVIEIVKIKYADLDTIHRNVGDIFPELVLSRNKENGQLILHGGEKTVTRALELIGELDIAPREEKQRELQEEVITEIIKVNTTSTGNLVKNIEQVLPEIIISTNEVNNQLILKGTETEIAKALEMIERLDIVPEEEENERKTDEKPQLSTIQVELKHGNVDNVRDEIANVVDNIEMRTDNINNKIIIRGPEPAVREAASLARKWDKNQLTVTEIVRIDYGDLERIAGIAGRMYPDVSLQINSRVKEIVIKGRQNKVGEVLNLIERLDVARRQVIIEARVEEVSSSALEEFGVDLNPDSYSAIHFIKEGADSSGDNPSTDRITGVELSWPSVLSAMKSRGASKTLANPRLLTLNGEEAKMLIGERVPVPVKNEDNEITYEFREVGITLQFTPWITENDSVELQISPEVSSVGERQQAGAPPSFKTREVTTKLRLKDGETFAIGGLIQEDESENVSRVPVLSEIPILGELFKHETIDSSRTELLIFITPHIVREERGNKSGEQKENDEQVHSQGVKGQNKEKDKEASGSSGEDDSITGTETGANAHNGQEQMAATGAEAGDGVHSGSSLTDGLSEEELEVILNYSRQLRDYTGEKNLPSCLNLLYTVGEGETVADIASLYGIKEKSIRFINNLENGLKEGDLITVPIPRSHLYRLKKGENLWRVARRFDFQPERLQKLNKIEDETSIPAGFVIILPGKIY